MLFFQLILAIASGVSLGVITGITPGIHVNLVSFLLIAYNDVIDVPIICKIIFIVAIAITHTFLDAIPTIYLGVPDSDTVLSVLPAHRMLLNGRAYEALKLTILGSLFSLVTIILLTPLFLYSLPFVYPIIDKYMAYILIGVVVYSFLKMKGNSAKFWSVFVFIISGCLGLVVLSMPDLNQPMLPMLSGLFGVSGILLSLKSNSKLPDQIIDCNINIPEKQFLKSGVIATFSGSLTGLFPGLGAAQAAIIGMQIIGDASLRALLVLLGGINTANFVFSLTTLYSLNKARNGAIIAISALQSKITFEDFFVIIASALLVAAIASLICLEIGKRMSNWITKIDYFKLNIFILILLIFINYYFTGLVGIAVLALSTIVGLIAPFKDVPKSNAMGCLLVPSIIYFLFR